MEHGKENLESTDIIRLSNLAGWIETVYLNSPELKEANPNGVLLRNPFGIELSLTELLKIKTDPVSFDSLGSSINEYKPKVANCERLFAQELERGRRGLNKFIELYRGILIENKEKHRVYQLIYNQKLLIQVVLRNYRESEGHDKGYIYVWDIDKNTPVLDNLSWLIDNLLTYMNYFLMNKQNRITLTSDRLEIDKLRAKSNTGYMYFPRDGTYTINTNTGLSIWKLTSGILIPYKDLQKGVSRQNGVYFDTLYEDFTIVKNNLEWNEREKPTLSMYLLTTWKEQSTRTAYSMSIVKNGKRTTVYSDSVKVTNTGYSTLKVFDIFNKKYKGLLTILSSEVTKFGITTLLNLFSLVDTYCINLDYIEEMITNLGNPELVYTTLTEDLIIKLINRIFIMALPFIERKHNFEHAFQCQLNSISIISQFKEYLGELIKLKEQINPRGDDALKALNRYMQKEIILEDENHELSMIINQGGKINRVRGGRNEDLFLKPEGKFELIKPKVLFMSEEVFLVKCHNLDILSKESRFEIALIKEESEKIYSLLNTRGNLQLSSLEYILTGMTQSDEEVDILKILNIGSLLDWCKTNIRISAVFKTILQKLTDNIKGVNAILNLVEILSYD